MAFNLHSAYISHPVVNTHANEPQYISGVTGPKFTNFSRGIIFIDSVNATIRVVIRPPVVE